MVLVGILIRLVNFLLPKSYWGDERFSIELASKPLWDILLGSFHDVHPPLYFILLGVFEPTPHSHFILWPRIASFLAGIAILILSYKLSTLWFGKQVGKITLFLVALSPYALQAGQETRGYGLASALVLACLYAATHKKVKTAALFGILAVWTEHYSWLVLLPIAALGAWPVAYLVLLGGFPMLALGVRQALYSEHVFHAYRVAEYSDLIWKKVGGLALHFSTGYRYSMLEWAEIPWQDSLFQFSIVITILMVSLALIGLARLRGKYLNLMLLGLVLPIMLLTATYPIRVDARYFAMLWPLYIMLVAVGLAWIDSFLRVFSMTLIGACLALGMAYQVCLPYDPIHKEDWASANTYVAALSPYYDGVLVTKLTNMQAHVREQHRNEVIAENPEYEYDGETRFPEDGLVVVYKLRSRSE